MELFVSSSASSAGAPPAVPGATRPRRSERLGVQGVSWLTAHALAVFAFLYLPIAILIV